MNGSRSSIGERLRKAREAKGASLEDASAETRIHHNVLRALEEDRFTELPSPMYVKGFLKRYADYLGLDPSSIVEEYLGTHPKEPEQILVLEGEGVERRGFRRFILLASAGVAILVALSCCCYFIIKSIKSIGGRAKEAERVVAKAEVAIPPTVAAKPPSELKKEPLVEPLRVSVAAREEVWLQVTVDGEVMFEDVISPGDKESWQAKDEIVLRVGNARAIELELNGKLLGAPGASGEVIERIVLTKEGMRIE